MENAGKSISLKKSKIFTTNNLVKMSILSVFGFVLMVIDFPCIDGN